jgi:arabinofuranosyltransferase
LAFRLPEKRLPLCGLAAAVVIFLALTAAYFDYTIDDTYISLRYARNVAAGEGFVFDRAVPPVEGYTNFLWIACEAALLAFGVPGDIVTWVKIVGVLWGVGALAAAYLLGREAYGAGAGAFAALLLAATGNFAFWAVGGLETTQYVCLILFAVLFTMNAGRSFALAAAAGTTWVFAALARPEGSVLAIVTLAYGAAAAPRGRPKSGYLIAGAVLALGYGAYFVWRYHFFGMFLPNTYYARAGISPASFLMRVRGVLPFLIYAAPQAVFALWLGRKSINKKAGLVWVAAAASLILAFAARREWMPGFRYELPFAAFLWIAAAGAFAAFTLSRSKAVTAVVASLALLYFFIPGVFLFKETSYTGQLNRAHVALGKWLRYAAPPGSSLATWDMGAAPYFSELPLVYDVNPEGLLSRETTRRGYNPAYFVARRPSFFILYSSRADGIAAPRGNWAWRYYRSAAFNRAYAYLFTFSFREDYHLRVYVAKGVELSPSAATEGAALASRSRNSGR